MTTMAVDVCEALRKAQGVDDESAKAAARAVLPSEQAATKGDIVVLRAELKTDIAELTTEIAELRTELKADNAELRAEFLRSGARGARKMGDRLRWMAGLLVAQPAVIVALVKLIP